LGVPEGFAPEDQNAMTNQALMGAGISLLQQSAPTREPRSFGGILGNAIQAGQAGAGQGLQMQDALKQRQMMAQRDAIRQRYAGRENDPNVLQNMFRDLIAVGDTEGAKSIAEVLKSQAGGQGFQVVKGSDGHMYRVGATGDAVDLGVQGATDRDRVIVQNADGKAEFAMHDPVTGTFEMTGQLAPGRAPTELERKAEFFVDFLPTQEGYISGFGGAPGRFEQAAQDLGVRELTSDELQTLDLAGNFFAEAWLRMTTGAAYNDTEFKNARRLFLPQPGDSAAALRAKYDNRRQLERSLRSVAGKKAINEFSQRDHGVGGLEVVPSLQDPDAVENPIRERLDPSLFNRRRGGGGGGSGVLPGVVNY